MMTNRSINQRTEPRQDQATDILTFLKRISGTSPVDVINGRMIVEPQAAAAAASNATDTDLEYIRKAHEMAMACQEPAAFEMQDAEFHKRIFASTRNELLTSLHDILRVIRNQKAWIEIKRRGFTEERRLAYCADHDAILKALYARNAEGAAMAMRAHLTSVNRNLFGRGGTY
jgi:DNA-binding FadR family transcriptional regulator